MRLVAAAVLFVLGSLSYGVDADTIDNVGDLYDAFREIAVTTGIFPGNDDIGARVVLYAPISDECVDVIPLDQPGNHGRTVTLSQCAWDNQKRSQHFRLRHQHGGKVSLVTHHDDCIGFGKIQGLYEQSFTGDFCDQPTHQFYVETGPYGAGFRQINDRSLCAEGFYGFFFAEDCEFWGNDNFLLCSLDGSSCWPNSREEARANKTEFGLSLSQVRPLTHSALMNAHRMKANRHQ